MEDSRLCVPEPLDQRDRVVTKWPNLWMGANSICCRWGLRGNSPIRLQPFHVSTRIVALVGHLQVALCLGTFPILPAPPGQVGRVPTSRPVSLPARPLTLVDVVSAVAHIDVFFERCPISSRLASPLWCSSGTALARSPHWTPRLCRERYKPETSHRVHQFRTYSRPRPRHATSSVDHQFRSSPIPQAPSSHHLDPSAEPGLLHFF